MSRSLQQASYQTDQGNFYALLLDESNSRGTINTVGGLPANAVKLFLPPAVPFVGTLPPVGFKPRYVNAVLATDPQVRRRFPIGNPAAAAIAVAGNCQITAARDGQVSDTPVVWNCYSVSPEKRTRSINFADSGQTDGTTTPVGA